MNLKISIILAKRHANQWLYLFMRSFSVRRLKAIIRDWAFSDYKWITRAQVHREIESLRWKHRDRDLVQRVLQDLHNSIR